MMCGLTKVRLCLHDAFSLESVRTDTKSDNFLHRARVIHQKRPFIIEYTGPTSTITTPNMSKKGTDERAKTGAAIRLHTTGFFAMTKWLWGCGLRAMANNIMLVVEMGK